MVQNNTNVSQNRTSGIQRRDATTQKNGDLKCTAVKA